MGNVSNDYWGNAFGFIGILLGIPIFSVVYKVFKEIVDKRLKKLELYDK